MVESALAITSALVLMASVVRIVVTVLVHFTAKMEAFARCQTTNANVVTDSTEQDATKSNLQLL
jgi:hypothetical protein